ncbi:MAG: hypothetical protein ACRCZF_19175, partial [Gemmataceae bacterium]
LPKVIISFKQQGIPKNSQLEATGLARIDNFAGSVLKWVNGPDVTQMPSYYIKNRKNDDPEEVYTGLAFDLSKVSDTNAIRVENVRVIITGKEDRELGTVVNWTIRSSPRPIFYHALLKDSAAVRCQLVEGERPTDYAVLFTEAEPSAKFRINLTVKDQSIYKTKVEVSIIDVKSGIKEVLTSQDEVWVTSVRP